MTATYVFFVRDSATGLGIPSLTPTWDALYYVATGGAAGSPNSPAIEAVGAGFYKFDWDVTANGALVGVIDAGALVVDRYQPFFVSLQASERADLAVQLLHNARAVPVANNGIETITDRDGGPLASYMRNDNGASATRTPTGDI